MRLTNPADNMCLPGEGRRLCVKIHRTKAGESALCARRAVSIQPVAARSGERVRPGSGSGPGPQLPPGGCGHPGSSPRPSALPRTYSGHSAPAFWGRGSSVTAFGRLLALPRQLSPRKPARPPATHHESTEAESSESDRGSGGPEGGCVEIGAVGW